MAEKKKSGIAGTVRNLIEKTVTGMGFDLWDVEFVKEGSEHYLRITIDNEEGITIDDCEKVHYAVDPLLDEADPIPDSYHLEIQSPGIERELRLPHHFEVMLGWEVEVRFFHTMNGRKSVTGVLADYVNDTIRLAVGDEIWDIPRADASRVTTIYHFEDDEGEEEE